MQAPRPAGAGTCSQVAAEHRLRTGGETSDLFMPDVHPLDVTAANRIRDKVERIPRNTPAVLHARGRQGLHDHVRNSFGHWGSPKRARTRFYFLVCDWRNTPSEPSANSASASGSGTVCDVWRVGGRSLL